MSSTRDQILRAAAELFARRGYTATSIRQVAERADANSALIYYYFGSKADLFHAALGEPTRELRAILERAVEAPGTATERLERCIRDYVHFLLARAPVAGLVFRSIVGGDTELTDAMRERVSPVAALLTHVVGDGIEAGEFRPVDPRLAVGSLIGMIVFFIVAAPVALPALGLEADDDFADRLAEHTATMALRGIRA